jgi:hypothetical protein
MLKTKSTEYKYKCGSRDSNPQPLYGLGGPAAMLFIDNKYLAWYSAIIFRAQTRQQPEGYTEIHHVIPRSLYKNKANNLDSDPDTLENLAVLTAREHYICHKLLTKITQGRNRYLMIYALWLMTVYNTHGQRYQVSSYEYQKNRELLSEARKGTPAWNKGKPRTAEEKAKIANGIKKANPNGRNPWNKNKEVGSNNTMWITNGNNNRKIKKTDTVPEGWVLGRSKVHSLEWKNWLSTQTKGVPKSPETRSRMSESRKNWWKTHR